MTQDASKTPMMKQYLELKQQYSDCMILFRAGDFYETFYDDAKECANLLGITLTKRADIPMAGVPFHSITPYIRKLLNNNKKVALCEQLEDPKQAKGLVKRGVTRIITPGTVLEDEYLSSSNNNFIMCLYAPKNISQQYGIALIDITTGEFLITQTQDFEDVKTLIKSHSPNEIILNESTFTKGVKQYIINAQIYYNFLSDVRFHINYANEILKKQFSLTAQELGIDDKEYATISAGALLFYIYKLQKLDLSHINKIETINMQSSMIIDSMSQKNLELTQSIFTQDQSKTLFGVINKTKTSAGTRLLKKHITAPLIDIQTIQQRLDSIEELNEFTIERNEIRESLEVVADIERITSRITSKIATPRDLSALSSSLQQLPTIKNQLHLFDSPLLKDIKKLDTFEELVTTLQNAIVSDPPAHIRDSGFLRPEYNQELKELSDMRYDSKSYLQEFEEQQRITSNIANLKVKYNRVFGYYIEIPNGQLSKVPQNYIQKQTLTNAQRYTTPELQELEHKIIGAEEKIKVLELELYDQLLEKLKYYVKSFQKVSKKLALLDVLSSHSLTSQLHNYIKPHFISQDNTNLEVSIKDARNPIVEQFVNDFVPNDTQFSNQETCKIISGPNMAGKSTYLRQTALISVLGQIGSFVPATSVTMKIYDRIFTRIGAHDELAEGQSTFMVEMSETASILQHTTSNSLVLLDEIGRGTSTYDGLAIAWAVTEELAQKQTHTIFATHYHQLNMVSNYLSNVENYHVVVKEEGNKIEFIRKIQKGGTDKSYGIYVAKLAGVPTNVVKRAEEIQKNIEEKEDIQVSKTLQKKSTQKETSTPKKSLDKFF